MSRASETTAIVSDIHFPHHMPAAWAAFREWHKETRPARTIIGGDFLDLAQLSSFPQDPASSVYVVPEIQQFVNEANALAANTGELLILEGNHEARWNRFIEPVAVRLKGAIGLTLKEQCLAQGLNQSAKWFSESAKFRGIEIQQFRFRHGDKDFPGRFGGGKHPASSLIDKTFGGESPITGHLHQCQMICRRRSDGTLVISICNPTFEKPADYSPGNPWVYGFTIVEKCSDRWATPHPIVIEGGAFAYGGKVYDGNGAAKTAAKAPTPAPDVMLGSRPPYPTWDRESKLERNLDAIEGLRGELDARLARLAYGEGRGSDRGADELPPPPPLPNEERVTVSGRARRRMVPHPETGVTMSVSEWARAIGIPRTTLISRLDAPGCDVAKALTFSGEG